MVYEHFSGCFILGDPSLRFSKLFQAIVVVARGDIFRLLALALGINRLLAMAKKHGRPLGVIIIQQVNKSIRL
jgi:hypothetical protein